MFKMNINPSFLTKPFVGVVIMAITFSALLIVMFLRFSYYNKMRLESDNHYDDTGYYFYYDEEADNKHLEIHNIISMKHKIKNINEGQIIHNEHRYGPVKSIIFVIVIQVHDKITYLKGLLECLKYSIGITNSLLIFSHDYYDDDINACIRNISFAKYIQIFYPYSTQLYPAAFPGDDPNFCSNDFVCEKSILRYAPHTQKKHFWWWQVNQVFDRLKVTDKYNGTVLFLEEDQYVLKDFLFILKVMESTMKAERPECEIISLGAYAPVNTKFHINDINLTVSSWNSNLDSSGIAFNRTIWNSIKDYSYYFCHFNDFRWDESLRHLGFKRSDGQFKVMSSEAPRVIRHKSCNGHIYCTAESTISGAKEFVQTIHRGLFPRNVIINTSNNTEPDVTAIGDWEDVRDQGLCMYFIQK